MAVDALERPNVAKKKAGRPKSRTRDEGMPVRIAADVVRMAKEITPAMGLPMSEYLSSLLRPLVSRDYVRELDRVRKQGGTD